MTENITYLKLSDYKTLSYEGRDHQGKGDALNYFFNKLEKENINVVTTSFPIYSTPIGNTIKEFLQKGEEQFGLSPRENLEVKMSLFALNRLEFLEAFLREDVDEKTLILFDRSAFSNALTIAYAMTETKDVDSKEILELVKTAMSLDALLIDTLNLKNCVVQLDTGQGSWKSAREKDVDLYEIPQVQEYARFVYTVYEQLVGEGWKVVLTQDPEGNWRNREDIFDEVYAFLIERLGSIRSGEGGRVEVGIREIVRDIYIGSEVEEELIEEYVKSIRNNDKSIMYLTSVEINRQICSSFKEICFTNERVKLFFREILERYPKIVDVLGYNLGEEYVLKLKEGLNYG